MRFQVFVRAGRMQYSWMEAKAVRTRLWRAYPCTDGEAPYSKIRWRP
jgi:hypothetical protein